MKRTDTRKESNAQQALSLALGLLNIASTNAPLLEPIALNGLRTEPIPAGAEAVRAETRTLLQRGGEAVNLLFFTRAYAEEGGTITSGNLRNVFGGTTVSNTTISGGVQNVWGGGNATSTTISGGMQEVQNGGDVTGTTISGGVQVVYGNATSTTINSGTQDVEVGGSATSTTINDGEQDVRDGGNATSTTISGGVQYIQYGGNATSTTINSGAQWVYGSATSTTISGGAQYIHYGGNATSTTISGGAQVVSRGGNATSTTIHGGTQVVSSGGSATSTMISSGAQNVNAGGSATGTTISGGVQNVYGSATSTTIRGGTQDVFTGGSVTNTTINSGTQYVEVGGNATSTTISGGSQVVDGSAMSTTINGGDQYVWVGANATSTTINGGEQWVLRGNAASTTINSGTQDVRGGGSATSTTINGGVQYVRDDGSATSTTISGGVQVVSSGGNATSTMISGGGLQRVFAGGTVEDANIQYGGTQEILTSGTALRTIIQSGGTQNIASGGTANGTTAAAGAVLLMQSGAILSGTTTLEQDGNLTFGALGTYNIAGLATNGGTITLAQAGSVGNRLNIASLTGRANFVINTDLAQNQADHITIQSAAGTAEHTLQVGYDPGFLTGKTITGNAEFATVPDQHTTFRALPTETGAYAYTPVLVVNPAGTTWSIQQLVSVARQPSETMYTASDTMAASLVLWRSENNSLIKRMGELRQASGEAGMWTRAYKGEEELQTANGRHSTQQYTALQGGWDTRVRGKHSTRYRGFAIGYLHANNSLMRGSGDASSLSIGAYSSWLGDDGHFLDIIAKQSRLHSHYTDNLNNAANTEVTGSYANWGTSLSAEYGYRQQLAHDWYLEPQAELSLGRISTAHYTTSDGTRVISPNLYTAAGRLGLAIGRSLGQSTFYAKASMVREFRARTGVTMQTGSISPLGMEQDLRENWLEFAIGMTGRLDQTTQAYMELDKTTGTDIHTPWMFSFGIRKSF